MFNSLLFINDIINVILGIMEKKRKEPYSKVLSQLNFIIGIFTLEP